MTDEPKKNIEDFTREYLRRIDKKLDHAGKRIEVVEQDLSMLKESIRRIDARVASMDSHMAGFYSATRWQTDEIDALKGRVEALEDTRLQPTTDHGQPATDHLPTNHRLLRFIGIERVFD